MKSCKLTETEIDWKPSSSSEMRNYVIEYIKTKNFMKLLVLKLMKIHSKKKHCWLRTQKQLKIQIILPLQLHQLNLSHCWLRPQKQMKNVPNHQIQIILSPQLH